MLLRLIRADQVDRFIRQGNFILVDLRRPSDFEKKHLLGAKNIPYDEFDNYIQTFQKGCPVIFYCDRGATSLLAAKQLSQLGIESISVIGGICAYRGKYLVS
ncbi:MAG: rhodanese-like domain-containing protein [Clostridiales bacterium]|nr:rhodanese-like domain-containing protein [Clostridiales bacterium]